MSHLPTLTIGSIQITIVALLVALAVVAVTWIFARFAGRAIERFFDGHKSSYQEKSLNIGILVKILIWIIGLELALHFLGIRLSTLFAASAFFALGAGFAIKNVVENFLSGGIIRIENSIRVGDMISVQGKWLTVRHLGARTVEAATFDGEMVLIPNSMIAESIIQNMTRRDHSCRVELDVGVAYECDLKLVRKTLENTVNNLDWTSDMRPPVVYLDAFGDSAVIYKIYVWIAEAGRWRRAKSDLHESIWQALNDAGVTIAFPQLDVHLNRIDESGADKNNKPIPSASC